MSEQKDTDKRVELSAQVDVANNTRQLFRIADKILKFNISYIETSCTFPRRTFYAKIPEKNVWIATSELVGKNILRIDVKRGEILKTITLIDGTVQKESPFSGISYIEGVEIAEMVYEEEGSYRSEYNEPPLDGASAAPKVKQLLKSLI